MKKTTTRNFYLLVSFLLTTILAFGQVTNGNDNGPGSLRDAIVTANLNPGLDFVTFDAPGITVMLTSGSILVTDALAIVGDMSTVDGASNSGGLFIIDNAIDAGFSGISFVNGTTDGDGGAVHSTNTALGFIDCSFINNTANGAATANSGGAIATNGTGTLDVLTSSFTGNTANRAGGAIEVNSDGDVTITDSTFDGNSCVGPPGNGGAIHLTTPALFTMTGGKVTNNSAASEGGGLWNNQGIMNIDNVLVLGNTALGADATNGGGGLFNNGGTLNVMNGTNIRSNTATGTSGSGGGIFSVAGIVTVDGVVMKLNTATRAGGGIEIIDGTLTVTNSTVNKNNAGGAAPAPGNGGALHVSGTNTIVTFTGTQVKNNIAAREGGGLWNMAGSTMTVDNCQIAVNAANGPAADDGGGGIFNNGGTLNVLNGTMIEQNTADIASGSGGGIFSTDGAVTVTDSELKGNSGSRAGGGIEVVNGTLNVTGTLFRDNAAFSEITGIGSPGNGGAIHVSGNMGTVTTIDNSEFYGNIAYDDGGALWNQAGSTMNVQNGTIMGGDALAFFGVNVAFSLADGVGGGGAIYNNGGTLNVDDTTIRQNLASGTSGSGGGILSVNGAVTITNSVIRNSNAVRAGGGIEMINGSLTFTNSAMFENTTQQLFNPPFGNVPNPGNGGGLHVTGSASVDIVNSSVNSNTASSEGGGLWNMAGAVMTVDNSQLRGNIALGDDATNGGGGIFNNGGTLNVLNRSRINGNFASGISGSGGGIFSTAGDVTLTNTTINGNSANRAGGAIEIIDGSIAVFRSEMNGNDVAGGAGIPNPGNGGAVHVTGNAGTVVNISASTVSNNSAAREGGGLWNMAGSEMYLARTAVYGNTSNGPAFDDGGGGIFNNGGFVVVKTSTISNNSSVSSGSAVGGGGNGGGIHNAPGGDLEVVRSTISGNGAGVGGGIFTVGNSCSLDASTVAFNVAEIGGGGLKTFDGAIATLLSSIVAGNDVFGVPSLGGPGFDLSGNFLSYDYNVVGINDQGAFTPLANDQIGDPDLGPLADNGGQTLTHEISPSSIAIDAGDPSNSSLDQIGQSPIGIRDSGAYEANIPQNRSADDESGIASTDIGFEVYPNPSKGFATLRIPASFGDNNQVIVFELASGKVVQNFQTLSGSRDMDFSSLANGMYIIKVISEKATSVQRLILAK